MPLYSSFYPVPMGQDSCFSSISGEFNESGEVTYVQCSSGEETYPNLIASIASNNGDALAPHPTSLYVDTPAAESFVSQSSANSMGYFDMSLHGQGESNENENWVDDCGEYNEGVLMSCTAPSFTTHQFAMGETPFYTTNYETIQEHAMIPAPFNFAPSTPPTFTHPTHHAASSKDTTDFWTSHPITQGISSDFSQRFCATHSSAHAFTRKSTTTSTATQTEDSPNVGETQPLSAEQYKSPTRSTARPLNHNMNRRSSRNFSCNRDGCTRSYHRKFELFRHQKTHTGVREHHCRFPTCIWAAPNGFTRKDHLKQHLRQVHKTPA